MDNFRKIDIDQYDEDVLHDSELYVADSRDPYEVLDIAKQRQAAVRQSLARCVISSSLTLSRIGVLEYKAKMEGPLGQVKGL